MTTKDAKTVIILTPARFRHTHAGGGEMELTGRLTSPMIRDLGFACLRERTRVKAVWVQPLKLYKLYFGGKFIGLGKYNEHIAYPDFRSWERK
jgi:hypothetical protein